MTTEQALQAGISLQRQQELDLLVRRAVNQAIAEWNNGGWIKDARLMKAHLDHLQQQQSIDRSPNPAWKGWRRVFSMPIDLYYKLREQRFDGREDFDRNPELMKWLARQKQTEWLKRYPLATEKSLIDQPRQSKIPKEVVLPPDKVPKKFR